MNYYTLAPTSNSPKSLSARFRNPATLAAWYRYGSYCPDVAPAFIVTYGAPPPFNVDISASQIAVIDLESDTPAVNQALNAIGGYLFNPAADSPIVICQSIGNGLYQSPIFRLIDACYEDSPEGKKQLEIDCLAATGIHLDLRKSMKTLKEEVWNTVKSALSQPPPRAQ